MTSPSGERATGLREQQIVELARHLVEYSPLEVRAPDAPYHVIAYRVNADAFEALRDALSSVLPSGEGLPLTRALERLRRIADIIVGVDERCMAADGPVTPTLREMTQAELSEIYDLAKDAEGLGAAAPAPQEKLPDPPPMPILRWIVGREPTLPKMYEMLNLGEEVVLVWAKDWDKLVGR